MYSNLTEEESKALYNNKLADPDSPEGYQEFQVLRILYKKITGNEAATCTCKYKSLVNKLKTLCSEPKS